MGEIRVGLTIYELYDEIEFLKWNLGVETVRITERFIGNTSLIVNGLAMEIEGDVVTFTDYDNIILNNSIVMRLFSVLSLLTIYKVYNECYYFYELNFKDGVASIEAM